MPLKYVHLYWNYLSAIWRSKKNMYKQAHDMGKIVDKSEENGNIFASVYVF